ncbi:hypothetical protein JG688_00008592 [Phytophthora aleatoria]|uniref:Uncharacterized protein n=1 Tax=Phytophthora aleatoria TaxID=2496075 RepID=A0A8J5J6W0_9STRA|nr:hypothetical protein JG688_00008592 [Phytophthora aleatoria]
MGLDARGARGGSAASVAEALEANRALVAKLQALEQSLAKEEAKLLAKTQSIRRGMALRRAKQAMDALLPPTPQKGAMMQGYERDPRTRKKPGVVPRSNIRQQVSFFTDEVEHERKVGRPKKKKQKTLEHTGAEDQEQTRLRALSEPPPNTDTEFLRAHSHEAFVAGPPTIFSSRERKVVKDFAEDFYMTHAPNEEIPLQVWNGIHKWQGMRKSRQLPIERSGFACKLCAKSGFTPEEDQILREAVPIFGEKWNVIADLLDGRVSEQIRHRWQLTLAPGLRRGKFSVIEDRRMLLALRAYVPNVSEYNLEQVAWNDISHHIPGRTQPAIRDRFLNCLNPELSFRKFTKQEDQIILARPTCKSMEVLSVNATSVARSSLSSRKGSTSRSSNTQYKMDEEYSLGNNNHAQPQLNPVVTSTKATRCYRPKEWSVEAEEAFRVQQTGWRDIKEYMETYGEPERWQNGFVRCTRVKANGYYTYWRPHRECDDKYLHTVKLFEYA